VGPNAPSQWEWGVGANLPHLTVMFFAEPGRLEGIRQTLAGQTWNAAFEEVRCLDTSDLGGFEPFGFMDGVSQPQPDWERARTLTGDKLKYENVVALGEFLLGYKNEYARYTERPVLDADAASAGLADAQDAPGKKDLGCNGTYLVLRSLRQDVRGFWRYVQHQAGARSADQDELAALLLGRKRSGDPLLRIQEQPIPGVGTAPEQIRLNQYVYDGDPQGTGCPFGAHIRRANPRNADYVDRPYGLFARVRSLLGFAPRSFRADLISSVRFHRLLRRGREYGPKLMPPDALQPAPSGDAERGLRFACVNANISRQFEFVQNAWMNSSKFNGMSAESDPLLGNRLPIAGGWGTDAFMIPREDGAGRCLQGMPRFVAVRGSAYFFLPSLRALQYFIGKGRA
jgi:deferrochelatase/peroxidase EfeB